MNNSGVMVFISRFLTTISILVVLKPNLISSLPQNSVESENIYLISADPNQDASSDSVEFHQNTAPIVNPDAFNTNDEPFEDAGKFSTPIDVSFDPDDSTSAMKTDSLNFNQNEVTTAANNEVTDPDCPSESDQENGILSGRGVGSGSCPPKYSLDGPTQPPNMNVFNSWLKKLLRIPDTKKDDEAPTK